MEALMKHKSIAVPINTSEEEVQLEDENNVLVKRRRTEFSGSIVLPQQVVEVPDMENKVPDGLPAQVSNGKDSMVVTECAVQSSTEVNGCSNGHVRGFPVTGSASSRLPKICSAIGWKEPLYDFEERGPPHNKLFRCKVTVRMEGLSDTIVECFGNPKPQKKAAKEHAAQGALWCLERFGHVKY
ncbi:hypothetical protein U9M48_014398 [Paspalum notatum var. saurae]|uniref:DRBM domain-containing protein n=1 Tax=Paspalum notatum var. saurae TaxID=547442 RepID=A0AAQ3WKR0_PASNO